MREDKLLCACLIDCDAEAIRRQRTRRRRALVLAVGIEAVLLGTLLLWPILTPGGLPPNIALVPRVFLGVPADKVPASPAHPMLVRRTPVFNNPVFAPVRIPSQIPTVNMAPPSVSASAAIGPGSPGPGMTPPGSPNGLNEGNWTIAPPQPPRLIRKSEGVQSGMLIHRVQPIYPSIARTVHVSGEVELRVIIGRDGAVRSVEVLSGNPLLVRAALDAVRQWRYRPTFLDGEAVEVETRITVSFVLGE